MFELAKRIAHNLDIPPELVIEVGDRFLLLWDGPPLEVEFAGDSVTITVRKKSECHEGIPCVETGLVRFPLDRDKFVISTLEKSRGGERVSVDCRVMDLDPIDREIREEVIRFGESLTAP
jgi:hypothetical protein